MQVDTHGADVALARPVPVSDVRAAASGVLGTSLPRRVARAAFVGRNASPQRLRDDDRIEGPMLVVNVLAVLVVLTLVLSMFPRPRVAARARS